MAIKALIWGKDDLYERLRPFYERAEKSGIIEIVGYATKEDGKYVMHRPDGSRADDIYVQIVILSTKFEIFDRMRELQQDYGIAKKFIVDGRVFRAEGFDLARLCEEGVAHVNWNGDYKRLIDKCYTIHPRIYHRGGEWTAEIRFGAKSYAQSLRVEGKGFVDIGKYTAISWETVFALGITGGHNYHAVSSFADFDFAPGCPEPLEEKLLGRLLVGSDVWIGRGAHVMALDWKRPTMIGAGAVIAADSVVVESVPPYAIVGGNPAKIIRYRFPEAVREKLLRIKWWDWEPEKIYENFAYFRDVEAFAERFDPGI